MVAVLFISVPVRYAINVQSELEERGFILSLILAQCSDCRLHGELMLSEVWSTHHYSTRRMHQCLQLIQVTLSLYEKEKYKLINRPAKSSHSNLYYYGDYCNSLLKI